jgi:acetylornithine deacetylase/succinyl-diaminopimelate desuccinylase-like protein
MNRSEVITSIERHFDTGDFLADLAGRVAFRTESQNPERLADLRAYLDLEMRPCLERLGFRCEVLPNPVATGGPFLFAERIEDPGLTTVFSYGHGDVIRGQEGKWRAGLDPWTLKCEGDRIYGRGTADNKGQHSINLAAGWLRRAAYGATMPDAKPAPRPPASIAVPKMCLKGGIE